MGANGLPNLIPLAGAGAEGYLRGQGLRTQEDQNRQGIALKAAEEGRQKESHKINMQQALLAIQRMQQQMDMQAEQHPMDMRAHLGRQVSPDFYNALDFRGATPPDLTSSEALAASRLNMTEMGYAGRGQGKPPDREAQLGRYTAMLSKLYAIQSAGKPMDKAMRAELYKNPEIRPFLSQGDPKPVINFILSRIKAVDPQADTTMFDQADEDAEPPMPAWPGAK